MKSYFQALRKYAVFTGRARRKEYWMFGVVQAVIVFAFRGIDHLLGTTNPGTIGWFETSYVFATVIPFVAVTVRRLHDTNRSGWWSLLLLIPLIGFIPTLWFMSEDGQPDENRFGPNPKSVLISGQGLQA